MYSIFLATTGMNLTTGAWFMLALGAIVIAHGLVLLTPLAARLGTASGPLMIAYSVLMLLNQGRMVLMPSGLKSARWPLNAQTRRSLQPFSWCAK
jgi:hypothetical protein